jgi:hypothetical protein
MSSTLTNIATATGTVTTTPPTTPKSNNTGAIGSGVVGGVLGLTLIVGVLGLLLYLSQTRRLSIIPTVESTARPCDEMSQRVDIPTERFSHHTSYTGATPNDANELSSEGKSAQDANQRLSSEGSEVHACPVLCCCFNRLSQATHRAQCHRTSTDPSKCLRIGTTLGCQRKGEAP